MSYTLYDATVVMAKGALTSLKRIITAAEQHPDSANFFDARLVEDMKPLTFQVYYATCEVEEIAAELRGLDYSKPIEDVDTYEKMHALIDKALQALAEVDKDAANGIGDKVLDFETSRKTLQVPIKAIATLHHMPNVYFHISMAYAILRKEGVPLGKRDWSRGFVTDYI